jgi:hypothetical protein
VNADTLDGLDSTYFASAGSVTLKADIESPTFTGNPTAPTPAPGDADTSIATTAFVTSALAAFAPSDLLNRPYSYAAGTAAPGFGQITMDSTGLPLVTKLYVDAFPSDGSSNILPLMLATIKPGGVVMLQKPLDVQNYVVFTVVAAPLNIGSGDYVEIGVKYEVTFGAINPAMPVNFLFAIGGGGGGGVTISDTPPALPQPGALWYEADSGNTYVYYDDGDSKQWVQINIQPAAPTAVPPGLTAQTRNRLVNGGLQVSQEYGRAAVTATNLYIADQWRCEWGGGLTGSSYASEVGPPKYIRMYSSAVNAVGSAYGFLVQPVEGIRIADFGWGAAGALPTVLRFKAKSSVANLVFSAGLRNGANTRAFFRNFTASATSNAWQDFVMPIPGDITGTWPVDTSAAMQVLFTGMATVGLQTPAGVWAAGNFIAATGIGNVFSAAAQWLDIAEIGLYLDPLNTGVPPRFEMPDEAAELLACMRYWERTQNVLNPTMYGSGQYKAIKRTAPALSMNVDAGSGSTANPFNVSGFNHSAYYVTPHSNVGQGNVTANARM